MNQEQLSCWLKLAILLVGVCATIVYLLLAIVPLSLAKEIHASSNMYAWLLLMYLSAPFCYMVLWNGWRIACAVQKGAFFCYENARCMGRIAVLAAFAAALFFFGNLLLLALGMSHPLILLFSAFAIAFGIVISLIAAVVSYLLQRAARLQEEQTLTI